LRSVPPWRPPSTFHSRLRVDIPKWRSVERPWDVARAPCHGGDVQHATASVKELRGSGQHGAVLAQQPQRDRLGQGLPEQAPADAAALRWRPLRAARLTALRPKRRRQATGHSTSARNPPPRTPEKSNRTPMLRSPTRSSCRCPACPAAASRSPGNRRPSRSPPRPRRASARTRWSGRRRSCA